MVLVGIFSSVRFDSVLKTLFVEHSEVINCAFVYMTNCKGLETLLWCINWFLYIEISANETNEIQSYSLYWSYKKESIRSCSDLKELFGRLSDSSCASQQTLKGHVEVPFLQRYMVKTAPPVPSQKAKRLLHYIPPQLQRSSRSPLGPEPGPWRVRERGLERSALPSLGA